MKTMPKQFDTKAQQTIWYHHFSKDTVRN